MANPGGGTASPFLIFDFCLLIFDFIFSLPTHGGPLRTHSTAPGAEIALARYHHHAALGDGEPAGPILFAVVADHRALRNHHVAVDDGAPDPAVPSHSHVRHQDRILHLAI